MSQKLNMPFNAVSEAAWKQKIQFDLKGQDYNETLLTQTSEGITIKPFYHGDSFEKISIPYPNKKNFSICQKIEIKNENEANKIALEAVEKGANSVCFIIKNSFEFNTVFKNLLGKKIPFHFEINYFSYHFFEELITFLQHETVFYNIDPIAQLAKTGNWFYSQKEDFSNLKKLLEKYSSISLIGVDSSVYQNGGANTVQQVAYALAHLNEYIYFFGTGICSNIQLSFANGSNYFFEIAKIRAFKYLFKLILDEYNTEGLPHIFIQPTLRNKSIYDYNSNMLRTTTECMSAILGEANTISNISYDSIYHFPNDFGERIARNQLLILKEESYFNNQKSIVEDSYYIEELTVQIAKKALEIFKDIEKGKGFISQLIAGKIQKKISEIASEEEKKFDEGNIILIGTNKYENASDRMKNELEKNPFLESNPTKTLIQPIIQKRLAEVYEKKRLSNEA